MKKIITIFIFGISLIFSSGCDIIDALENYEANIAGSVDVNPGPDDNAVIVDSEFFCLSDNDTYKDYAEQVERIEFAKAAYRTDPTYTGDVRGDITVTLAPSVGSAITRTIINANPLDYISTPYELELTEAEITELNDNLQMQLEAGFDICINASVSITVTSGTPPYYVDGVVDYNFKAEINLE
jgi:hypothetical protein